MKSIKRQTQVMWIVYGIGTLIIVGAALILPGILLRAHPIKPPSTIGAPGVGTGNTSDAQFGTSFSAAEDHFTARFPAYPTAKTSTLAVSGGTATVHDYSSSNDAVSYSVEVVTYPSSISMSDKDARLKAAANGGAKATNGTLERSKLGTFGGERSIESVTRVTLNGQEFRNYSLLILKGQKLYSVLAIHSNEADFAAFKRAFHLMSE